MGGKPLFVSVRSETGETGYADGYADTGRCFDKLGISGYNGYGSDERA